MRALRNVYDFITGGSIASPIALACGIAAAIAFPRWAASALTAGVAIGFAAGIFEREP